MGMCIAVVSQKGGVGKTTLTANLGAAFADLQFKTLVIEADPQGSLIRSYGLDRFDVERGLYGCIVSRENPADSIERDVREHLDLMAVNVWSHEEEAALTQAIGNQPGSLRTLVQELAVDYDYVLIDCPPGLGPVSRACLTAADRYLVPLQAEAMNLSTLARLNHLAESVRASDNPELGLEGYVVTLADLRTRHANDVIENLSQKHPHELLQTIIPRSIKVAEEAVKGRPTVVGFTTSRVGKAFQCLAEEILSRHSRRRAMDAAAAAPDVEVKEEEDIEAWNQILRDMPAGESEPVKP